MSLNMTTDFINKILVNKENVKIKVQKTLISS